MSPTPIFLTSPWYHIAFAGLATAGLAYWAWRDFYARGWRGSVGVRWLLALGILALWMPSLLFNRVRLDDEAMQWRAGYWWAVETGTIRFADVASIHVRSEKRQLTKGRSRMDTVWALRMKDGRVEDYIVFPLWMEHYQQIRSRFEAAGIVIDGGP